jgi:hypothetical protein
MKQEGRHFNTTEVIEAESQVVLNTLTEDDFRDAFQNGRSADNGTYARKGTTSRLMGISPKLFLDQIAAPVPEIMDGCLCRIRFEF